MLTFDHLAKVVPKFEFCPKKFPFINSLKIFGFATNRLACIFTVIIVIFRVILVFFTGLETNYRRF